MNFIISKRALIRSISFVIATIVVLSILAYNFSMQAAQNQRTLEYHYMKNIEDLTTHVENLNSDLTKTMYTKSPAMLSMLSSKLWREAGLAKESLSTLPIEYLSLQNTNKLLSQVGDYCVSLSKGYARGEKITEEQRDNLNKLNNYCDTMLSEVIAVNDAVSTGSISFEKVTGNIKREIGNEAKPAELAEGFLDFEEGFTAYPTLIYDGPFSDHLLQKEPLRLKNEKNVSRAEAKQKASKVTGIDIARIEDANDEDSKMPSYGFSSEGIDISITKKGGLLSYMLRSRDVKSQELSAEEAQAISLKFMQDLNIGELKTTYYEISNNVITTNYAYTQDGILIYPDLIKISVALDNGEIMGFDSRGYIVNNYNREYKAPLLSEEAARLFVSENLTIEKAQLCIIPSDGLKEILCYEFKCKSQDDSAAKDVLVYINADSGAEERILMLLINENGQLTI